MILIAPDKFKGTLTASEAASAIAKSAEGKNLILPMADGGEGTSEFIAGISDGWEMADTGIYINRELREAAVDAASMIGLETCRKDGEPLERTSRRLGRLVSDIYFGRYRKITIDRIYIGIGGTGVCDGGAGFLNELSPDVDWSRVLIGLADVAVPLLPQRNSALSALSFCPQKGYSEANVSEVKKRLKELVAEFGSPKCRFAGAGGGLGYALGDVIKAPVYPGAETLLNMAHIPWDKVTGIITGEGRFDAQTGAGKVVAALASEALRRDIPIVCLAGSVADDAPDIEGLAVVDSSRFLPGLPLCKETARLRLQAAMKDIAGTL